MRIKILGAAVIAVGLGLVGCSSSSSSSSTSSSGSTGTTASNATTTTGTTTTGTTTTGTTTTGTTGHTTATTSSSTGSSGTTGPGPGQRDTDCGATAHATCHPGTHCQNFQLTATKSVYACGCSFDDGGTSCLENDVPGTPSSGKIVCDRPTFDCRFARDFEQPSFGSVPTTALPDGGQGGTLPDGGFDISKACDANYFPIGDGQGGSICIGNCSTSSDCSSNFTFCRQGGLSITQNPTDGGPSYTIDAGSYCDYNLCGPDLTKTVDGGSVPDPKGQYFAACDATAGANDTSPGASDGFCDPLPGQTTPYIGICWRNGTGALGAQCSGLFGPNAGSCASGEICLETGIPPGVVGQAGPIPTAECLASCNASTSTGPQKTCPTVGGTAQTCHPFSGDPAGNQLKAGYCN